MKNIESDLNAMNARLEDQKLKEAIAEFRAEHGSKPDAVITIDGTRHVFKVLKCDRRDDLFFIDTEGEPTHHRRRGPTLNVQRSSAYGQGGYLDSISFRNGEDYVGLTGRNGRFVGDRFEFDGQATASNLNSSEKTSVSLKLNVACGS